MIKHRTSYYISFISYLVSALTAPFEILSIVIILRLLGGIIERLYKEYWGTISFNIVDRSPYLVSGVY